MSVHLQFYILTFLEQKENAYFCIFVVAFIYSYVLSKASHVKMLLIDLNHQTNAAFLMLNFQYGFWATRILITFFHLSISNPSLWKWHAPGRSLESFRVFSELISSLLHNAASLLNLLCLWQSAPVAFYRLHRSDAKSTQSAIPWRQIYLPVCCMVRVIDNQSLAVTGRGLSAVCLQCCKSLHWLLLWQCHLFSPSKNKSAHHLNLTLASTQYWENLHTKSFQ